MDTDLILLDKFIKERPVEAAHALEGCADEEAAALLKEIPTGLSLRLISQMNAYKVSKCLAYMDPGFSAGLFEKMDLQVAALFLRQLEASLRSDILGRLSAKRALALRQKLAYPDQSVGALMAPLDFTLREDTPVREAIKALRREKAQDSTDIFVVNRDGVLTGIIRPQGLLLATGTDPVSAAMKTDIPKAFASQPAEAFRGHPAWYEYRSIPVVDISERLIGALSLEAVHRPGMESGGESAKHILETGNALGELYRIGLSAFLQSVSK